MADKSLGAILHEKQDQLGLETAEVAEAVDLTRRHYHRLLSDDSFNGKPYAHGLKLLNAKRIGVVLSMSLDEIAHAVEHTESKKP
ncbi:MAG: hypothetical protein ABIY70_08855 [Capsulimonas sp.]|uniref:hypothetical protein n=1 Tax=Capsulimonas sp. TaxID=2494211 RepID=UPI003267D8BF